MARREQTPEEHLAATPYLKAAKDAAQRLANHDETRVSIMAERDEALVRARDLYSTWNQMLEAGGFVNEEGKKSFGGLSKALERGGA